MKDKDLMENIIIENCSFDSQYIQYKYRFNFRNYTMNFNETDIKIIEDFLKTEEELFRVRESEGKSELSQKDYNKIFEMYRLLNRKQREYKNNFMKELISTIKDVFN